MLRTRVSTMPLVVWMLAFVAMAAAQPRCDPITQYVKNGECCKMCPPGTRMPSSSSCLDPQCAECEDNEYQDKYTTEPKCLRQPYCDPNRNFEVLVLKSKKQRSTCMCKEGFHCSSAECITCVPHTTCEPGYGAQSKGNHTHDTVCQKCAKGTFSDEDSWYGVCRGWTECADGYRVLHGGTGVSDVSCEAVPRTHLGLIIGCSLGGALLIGFLSYCLCKGDGKRKMMDCVESSFLGEKREPLREANVLITNPTDPGEDGSTMPELLSSQEDVGVKTPEENEDELSQEMSGDALRTENGKLVTQENGKTSILSRQESQPQTFIVFADNM